MKSCGNSSVSLWSCILDDILIFNKMKAEAFETFGHGDEKATAGEIADQFEEVFVHVDRTHISGFYNFSK